MRKQILPTRDVIALGFMTLALFLGAGNIIYPPIVGKMTGEYYLISSIGFNISGVLLPMLAVIVLAEKKGDPLAVCAPMGKFWGAVLASSFYLFLGVFFASPRTATVSYEMGVANFLDKLPLTSVSLAWVLPTALAALLLLLKDKASNKVVVASN
ncbi:branched-chain amino acid transport system II carrier protein [Lelliottia sp. WAP21]|uniref:branched-chain amino acid transport system II carrier protein n=1 Tax=Lelliottia sp. WAP21 TaxID=2877426 RepID=UPI001E3EC490|nr:branched-chain amino acid transport system II carrier protein [Lelliottia sp. WAP21]